MPEVRRRPRDRDDEPEERPRSRRDRDDEEPDDEPRSRRRVADEDDDDEPPRRSRRDEPEDDDDRPRRSRARDDDDEDEKPRRGASPVRKGWDGYRAVKDSGGDFADELKIGQEPELVKFLEEEPCAIYRQHWVDNLPNGIKKRSWTCLEDDCPLCDIGDRAQKKVVFNVLHLSGGGDPENKILILGTKAAGQVKNFADEPKTGPLSRDDMYWAISKSGKGTGTAYNFAPVKERDLEEDWQIEPLSKSEMKEALSKCYDDSVVLVPQKGQLRDIARYLSGEDD